VGCSGYLIMIAAWHSGRHTRYEAIAPATARPGVRVAWDLASLKGKRRGAPCWRTGRTAHLFVILVGDIDSLSSAMGLTTILTTIWVCPPKYAEV
jgi:hypothetical protein